jgi:hypothetical protein
MQELKPQNSLVEYSCAYLNTAKSNHASQYFMHVCVFVAEELSYLAVTEYDYYQYYYP